MEKTKVYFAGVDEWNRPVFRSVLNARAYYCDVNHLFDYQATEKEVLEHYGTVGTSGICYKGTRFDSEPYGDPANVEILTREAAHELLKERKEEKQ